MHIRLDQFSIIYILFGLFGFPLFILMSLILGVDTSVGSIVFRALIASGGLYLLLKSSQTKYLLRFGPLSVFIIVYSVRFVYDLSIKEIPTPFLPREVLYMLYFGSVVIPVTSITYAKIDIVKLNRWFFYSSIVHSFCIFFGLYMLYGSNLADLLVNRFMFNETMSDGNGSPLNPILVSRSGTSLLVLLLVNRLYSAVRLKKLYFYMCLILSIFLLLVGGSRGPLVVGILLLSILVFNYLRSLYIIRFLRVFLLSIVAFIVVKMNSKTIGIFTRLNESLLNQSGVKFDREDHFLSAWNQFISHPLLGDKIFDNHLGWYPHNIFLESLMAVGLVGGIFLIYATLKSVISGYKAEWMNIYWLFICYTLFALSSGSIWNSFEFWILIAVLRRVSIPLVDNIFFNNKIEALTK